MKTQTQFSNKILLIFLLLLFHIATDAAVFTCPDESSFAKAKGKYYGWSWKPTDQGIYSILLDRTSSAYVFTSPPERPFANKKLVVKYHYAGSLAPRYTSDLGIYNKAYIECNYDDDLVILKYRTLYFDDLSAIPSPWTYKTDGYTTFSVCQTTSDETKNCSLDLDAQLCSPTSRFANTRVCNGAHINVDQVAKLALH